MINTWIQRMGAVCVFAVTMGVASSGQAASIAGKVTFVGTLSELATSNGQFYARFRVRVSGSTCDGGSVRDRWIEVRSGSMSNPYEHNDVNTRNAYSTLMAALLSGKSVQIDNGSLSCTSTASQVINLWVSNIGVY